MKKVISLIAIVMVFVFSVNICLADTAATPPEQTTTETKHPMKDLDPNSELAKSVLRLYEAGVINGYKEADGTYTYRADKSITRGEFCKMINTTFGYTVMANNKFKDVNSKKWYYHHVLIAIHHGYIQGHGDGTFGGDGYITREQVCVILDRIINKKAETKPQITDKVSSWAKEAVENIVGLGYMPLEEDGKFRAKDYMTRGEHAMTLDDFVTVKTPEENTDKDKPQEDKKEEQQKPKPSTPSGGSPSGEEDSDEYEDIGGSDDSTEKSYTITYNADGGKFNNKQKESYKSSDADYTLPIPTKSGYKFMGWFEDKNADFTTADPVTKIPSGSSGNKVFYAKWAKEYTINYELYFEPYGETMPEHKKGKLDGTEKKKYTAYDEEYVLPIPTRQDGKEFMGWYELKDLENDVKAVFYLNEHLVTSIPAGSDGDKYYQAVWSDMPKESKEIYTEIGGTNGNGGAINDLTNSLYNPVEGNELNMPGDSLTVLTMALQAMKEVYLWQDMGVLVHNRLVRDVYKSEADYMRDIIRGVKEAGEYESFLNEMTKIPSYTLMTIKNIFNIHDLFLEQ